MKVIVNRTNSWAFSIYKEVLGRDWWYKRELIAKNLKYEWIGESIIREWSASFNWSRTNLKDFLDEKYFNDILPNGILEIDLEDDEPSLIDRAITYWENFDNLMKELSLVELDKKLVFINDLYHSEKSLKEFKNIFAMDLEDAVKEKKKFSQFNPLRSWRRFVLEENWEVVPYREVVFYLKFHFERLTDSEESWKFEYIFEKNWKEIILEDIDWLRKMFYNNL